MNTLKRFVLTLSLEVFLLLISFTAASGQLLSPRWNNTTLFERNVFIENKGQFSDKEKTDVGNPILYYTRKGKLHIYFSAASITFRYDSLIPGENNDNDAEEKDDGKEENVGIQHLFMTMNWEGADPNAKIEVEQQVSDYFTYGDPNNTKGNSGITAHGWEKLTYRNLYPNIDVVYYYPKNKEGIEYDIIVHPGGDISKVKMHYSNNAHLSILNKNVQIISPCATFIDHAPIASTTDGSVVSTAFSLNSNTVTFSTGNYDKSKELKIDPWVYTTAFTGYNKAYILDYDLAGNVYAYGGGYPYQEIKLNNAGALQWTYTTTFVYSYSTGFSFFGGFCVDGSSGKAFMSEGFDGSGAQILGVTTAGTQFGLWNGLANYDEIWEMQFDNCLHKGVMIGGGTASPSMQTCVLDTTLTTFNPVQTVVPSTGHMDLACLAIDNTGACYILTSQNAGAPTPTMIKVPITTLTVPAYSVVDGYTFSEIMAAYYIPGTIGYAGGNGFNGLAISHNFVYTYDGGTVKKWAPATGALLASTIVYPTPYLSGGITVDECDHIYLGSNKNVLEYDVNLTLLNTLPMTDTVFDVKIGPGNNIPDNVLYACGRAFVSATHIQRFSTTITPTGTCSCNGSATVSASATCAAGPFVYAWSNGQTTQTASNLCVGNYTVTITDNGPCIPTVDTAIVHIIGGAGSFAVTTVGQNAKCFGEKNGQAKVNPTGTPPFAYTWSDGTTNQSDTGLAPGTYTCIVKQAGGCTDTVKVVVGQPTALSIIRSVVPDTCGKADGGATVSASGGTAPYSYLWTSGSTQTTLTGIGAGSYTVAVKDSNSCPDTAMVHVFAVGGNIPVGFMADSLTGCYPTCISFLDTATGGPKITGWLWNFGDKDTSSTQSPTHCYTAPGIYTISLTVTTTGGCGATATTPNYITIYSHPHANFTWSPEPAQILLDPTVQFTDMSTDSYGLASWYWPTFGDASGVTSIVENPSHTYTDTGTFCPMLIVKNIHGCIDTTVQCVEVDPLFTIYIPNAFSPNGDGLNDTFMAKGDGIHSFEMWIFNRWGETLYHTTNIFNGWNGSFNNNNVACQEDTYVYMINVTDIHNQPHSYLGRVSIVR